MTRFDSVSKLRPLGIMAPALIACFALAVLPKPSLANLIVDPAFTLGLDVNGLSSETGVWHLNQNAEVSTSGISVSGCCSSEVNDSLGFEAGSVSQLVDTDPGQLYDVNFWLATDGSSPDATFSVRFAGVYDLDAETEAQIGTAPYTFMDYDFLATATSSVSEFAFIGYPLTSNAQGFIDDVSVNPVPSAPEPSSFILLITGSGLFVAGAYRSRGFRSK